MNFYYQVLLKSDKSDRLQLNSFSRIIDRLRVDFLGFMVSLPPAKTKILANQSVRNNILFGIRNELFRRDIKSTQRL